MDIKVIDGTENVRLIQIHPDAPHCMIQRFHPRTGWFNAFAVANERDGRASLGSFAELIGEMDQLSAETMALR